MPSFGRLPQGEEEWEHYEVQHLRDILEAEIAGLAYKNECLRRERDRILDDLGSKTAEMERVQIERDRALRTCDQLLGAIGSISREMDDFLNEPRRQQPGRRLQRFINSTTSSTGTGKMDRPKHKRDHT